MSDTYDSSNPREDEIFWLLTRPHPVTPGANRFSNLYVRLHGSGSNAVLMTPQPPKFLRSHISPTGQVIFTSWADRHKGRSWGFVLGNEPGKNPGGWAPMEIVESSGTEGFVFEEESDMAHLVHESPESEAKGAKEWEGWMICEWAYGHPQLFWITEDLMSELPEYCERVYLTKVPVEGQGPESST